MTHLERDKGAEGGGVVVVRLPGTMHGRPLDPGSGSWPEFYLRPRRPERADEGRGAMAAPPECRAPRATGSGSFSGPSRHRRYWDVLHVLRSTAKRRAARRSAGWGHAAVLPSCPATPARTGSRPAVRARGSASPRTPTRRRRGGEG